MVILPVVLFIGVAMYLRLGSSNYHEAMCVVGMNRIRAAYLELAPDLERYFVMSAHDDRPGVGVTMGVQPGGGLMWIAHLLAGTPTVVILLNSVLAGVIAAIAALRGGAAMSATLGAGVLVFAVAVVLHALYARRSIAKTNFVPRFPTPAAKP